jgi:zinc transporter, ZIP family
MFAVIEAGLWGLAGGSSLVVGAVLGAATRPPERLVAWILAFGAGTLISALAFELTEEAFHLGGLDAVALGIAIGALAFFLGARWIDRMGGHDRKRMGGQRGEGSAWGLLLGAVLDGVPESLVIGASLIAGGRVAVPVVAAVFLSNVPEALSSARGFRQDGRSVPYTLGVWGAVTAVSGLAAAVGFAAFRGASPQILAVVLAVAAGAIVTMLADTMMPEAFEHGGSATGLWTALGFGVAFFLSTLA